MHRLRGSRVQATYTSHGGEQNSQTMEHTRGMGGGEIGATYLGYREHSLTVWRFASHARKR
jgi:hypothetical protein